jgi:2-polyprenyl-3-methyl-5-hydroxy-6-metoxy-1,4-benzoquinol methylase
MATNVAHAPFYGRLTPFVQRSRLAVAKPFLSESSLVLDIGCGLTNLPGTLTRYVGCDRNEEVLSECRRRYPRATFVAWDVAAEEPPDALLSGERFDAILMLAILEHLGEPARALARAKSLLAPGGKIIATTPHPAGHIPLDWGARLGLLSPHAHEEHEDLLNRAALEALAEEAGLRITDYKRFLLGMNQLVVFSSR